MNINQLKSVLFGKLPHAMSFVGDKGMRTVDVPNCVKKFGSTIYFYNDDQDWLELMPPSRVIETTVNF